MSILIVYATTEGQTRTICEFLEEMLNTLGYKAQLVDSTIDPPSPDAFDGVIVAASIHAGKYQSSIEHYMHTYANLLNEKLTAFIPVSLTAAADDEASWKELREHTQHFLDHVGFAPDFVEHTAGALKYSEYDFFKRFIMRMIARKQNASTDTSKDYEYTDYKKLEAFVKEFVS